MESTAETLCRVGVAAAVDAASLGGGLTCPPGLSGSFQAQGSESCSLSLWAWPDQHSGRHPEAKPGVAALPS